VVQGKKELSDGESCNKLEMKKTLGPSKTAIDVELTQTGKDSLSEVKKSVTGQATGDWLLRGKPELSVGASYLRKKFIKSRVSELKVTSKASCEMNRELNQLGDPSFAFGTRLVSKERRSLKFGLDYKLTHKKPKKLDEESKTGVKEESKVPEKAPLSDKLTLGAKC